MTEAELAAIHDHLRLRVLAVCRAILRDPDEVDDAVQETLVRVVARAAELRGDPTGYAVTVARNVCRDELRRRTHRRSWRVAEWDTPSVGIEDTAIDRRLIAEAWQALPANERPVLADAVRGLSLNEMAAMRGISVAAMAQRVRRARLRIRSMLDAPAIAAASGQSALAAARDRVRVFMATTNRRSASVLLQDPTRTVAPLLAAAIAGAAATPAAVPHTSSGSARAAASASPSVSAALSGAGAVARIPPGTGGSNGAALTATAAAAPGQQLQAVARSLPSVPPDTRFTSFTPSPHYQQDHTVFGTATGTVACGTSCGHLYRSSDGGHTWRSLGGSGLGFATLLLSPHFPADSTLFAMEPSNGLLRSDDGGASFTMAVAITDGSAAIDPSSAAGDTRVFVLPQRGGVLAVYNAASRTVAPAPAMAPDVNHVDAVFSAAGASTAFVEAQGPVSGARLYACTQSACNDVGPSPGVIPVPSPTFAEDHTFFYPTSGGVEVTTVGGASHVLPIENGWTATTILPAHDYASSGRVTVVAIPSSNTQPAGPMLFAALRGETLGHDGSAPLPSRADSLALTRLPDGRLILPLQAGGLECSGDDGASWSATC